MIYRVEPLADHELDLFRSGNAALDEWLARNARNATPAGTRTYLLVDQKDSVIGYFAIAPHLLLRDEAPARLAREAPRKIPAVLLAKLALDETVQGQGLGSDLLVHALRVIVTAARSAGGRVVLVDAIDDAAREFYEHHDLEPLPSRPLCLVMKLSTAGKALGEPWR